jgi:cytochrome o ubiquinol oxidase subunit II
LSGQFSGDGFPDMQFDVRVVSPLAFPDRVRSTAQTDRVLNADSYAELARQSVASDKPAFRLDDVRLFEKIATQQVPPGPGPKLVTQSAQSYLGGADAR